LARRLSIAAVVALIALGIAIRWRTRQQQPYAWALPAGFPIPRVPADNPMSEEKVLLGRYLFYDKRLSANQTQSCASCHQQGLAFTDGRAQSLGSTGETHPRSSMTLVNVAYAGVLTWVDPQMLTLEAQALVPLLGVRPVELGMGGQEVELIRRLRADARYRGLFPSVFPGSDPFSVQNVARAIAAFERTILSARSPYDRYYFGGDASALNDSAKRGEALFFTENVAGCYRCHGGFNFSDSTAHNTAVEAGAQKFKVPTLRNIAVTAPYMHNGSMATLEEVLDHYAAGGRVANNPDKDARMIQIPLTEQNRKDLLAFLRSLTDDEVARDPRFSDPFR
jgi:cytochrome c peroxidase